MSHNLLLSWFDARIKTIWLIRNPRCRDQHFNRAGRDYGTGNLFTAQDEISSLLLSSTHEVKNIYPCLVFFFVAH